MRWASSHRIFSLFAWLYAWYTNQETWEDSIGEMVKHLPPSAGEPRVLDLGCGPGVSALTMANRAPEARLIGLDYVASMLHQAQEYTRRTTVERPPVWVQADASRLPLADGTVDAVTGHSFLYLVENQAAVLAEAKRVLRPGGRLILVEPMAHARSLPAFRRLRAGFRFILSVTLWRIYVRWHNPFSLKSLALILRQAGFTHVLAQPALAGLAILGRGERPHEVEATVERIARVAEEKRKRKQGTKETQGTEGTQGTQGTQGTPELRTQNSELRTQEAGWIDFRTGQAPERGRAVFVLIHQEPNQPGWQPLDEASVTWELLTVTDRATGEDIVLGFTSLIKAVQFMQPAVLAGLIREVNKVGKFSWEVARTWQRRLWLNPPLERFQGKAAAYQLPGRLLPVDYQQREKQEE